MIRREQAEHLLDAYVAMENGGGDNRARQALREVILDAMSWTAYTSSPSLTQPHFGNGYRPYEIKTAELRLQALDLMKGKRRDA